MDPYGSLWLPMVEPAVDLSHPSPGPPALSSTSQASAGLPFAALPLLAAAAAQQLPRLAEEGGAAEGGAAGGGVALVVTVVKS